MQTKSLETVRVVDSAIDCPELPIVTGPGLAKAVIWPGSGAEQRSMHSIRLEGGAATVQLTHPSDCVYYVVAGKGVILDISSGTIQHLGEGTMVHIDAGDGYQLRADNDGISLVGGPCPPDPAFYDQTGAR